MGLLQPFDDLAAQARLIGKGNAEHGLIVDLAGDPFRVGGRREHHLPDADGERQADEGGQVDATRPVRRRAACDEERDTGAERSAGRPEPQRHQQLSPVDQWPPQTLFFDDPCCFWPAGFGADKARSV